MARDKLEQSRHCPAVRPDHTRVIEPCCRPFSFCGQVFADRVKKIGVPGVNPIFPGVDQGPRGWGTGKHKRKDYLSPVGGAPLPPSGSRWSAILYRPPYGFTGWGKRQTGHEVVLRTLTLHLPTNMPPPLHSDVIYI